MGEDRGIEAAAQTDIGLVRHSNQDSFGGDDGLRLYAVCDGMGGAAGGEVASRIAIDTFLTVARQEIEAVRGESNGSTGRALQRAAAAANRAVCAKAAFDTRFRGMGTTLVAARIEGAELTALNVGDSRAYLLRGDTLRQVTIDHSYLAEQVERGLMTPEQAEASSLQSVITRAVGAEPDVHPDLFHEMLQPHDTVLLCSDGLTRHVDDADLAETMLAAQTEPADVVCERLVELAKERGGSDNITCWVIRIGEPA
ncbi:MAG: protein phosphatase 2C domain-containing protein [Acidobacteriota bacterium]